MNIPTRWVINSLYWVF